MNRAGDVDGVFSRTHLAEQARPNTACLARLQNSLTDHAIMHLVLYEPEIPPNTGNIARLCAATQTRLHLVEPLGFSLDDRYLRRAGLDYWPHVSIAVWSDWEAFAASAKAIRGRLVLTSSKTSMPYHEFAFEPGDFIVLGPETRGLPSEILSLSPHCVRIPIWGQVRSLNLATSAGILLYEALRQTGGLADK